MNARSQNWEAAECNAANWVLTSTGYPPQQGVPWREGPSSAQMVATVYSPQPLRAPVVGPVQQGRGQQHDFQIFWELVYFNCNGVPVQPVHRRVFYDEIERAAYDRATVAYNNSQSVALFVPPMLSLGPTMGGPYPMAAPSQMALPASDRLDPRQHTIPPGHHVPSSESLNPNNSPTRECARAEDSVHIEQTPKNHSSARKQRRDAQQVYEAEEADKKARSLKPHAIGCDSVGLPDETQQKISRGFEVFLHNIPRSVYHQGRVARSRRLCESACRSGVRIRVGWPQDIRHGLQENGVKVHESGTLAFAQAVHHKLGPEQPPREEPCVWDLLKTYWKSPEFEKVSKVRFFFCHNAHTTFNMYVYAEKSAHVGRICMVMDMRISIFIVGGGEMGESRL
jgi:hypothetical protein